MDNHEGFFMSNFELITLSMASLLFLWAATKKELAKTSIIEEKTIFAVDNYIDMEEAEKACRKSKYMIPFRKIWGIVIKLVFGI